MDEQLLKQTIAKNLSYYRKINHLTQLELAEKLNYSDKSVSKWERGEGVPDVFILQQLAELYGITLNDFVSQVQRKRPWKPREHRLLIALLSAGLVWFITVIAFVFLKLFLPNLAHTWLCFIFGVPVCAIVLLVLTAVWKNKILCCIFVSALNWGAAFSVFFGVYLGLAVSTIWLVFIVAFVFQILILLWFRLKRSKKKIESL